MRDLRLRFLAALSSGGLLAVSLQSCGGVVSTSSNADAGNPMDGSPTPADATPEGRTVASDSAPPLDGALPPVTCSYGKPETECFTHDGLATMYTNPSQGGDIGDAGRVDAASAPWDPNGCLPRDLVRNGCCNPAAVGPSFTGTTCCYTFCAGSCCGRPILIDGEARLAPATRRSDWAPEASLGRADAAVAALDPITRAHLARAWLDDARMEHASIASFARFTLDLLIFGAPPELVAESQRASLDEIVHARLCFALASRFAGQPLGPGPLDLSGARPSASLAEAVVAAVREGCIGETVASLIARAELERATDAEVRATLATIADDEARHAELAWRFVGWAIRTGGDTVRQAAQRAFRDDLLTLGGPRHAHDDTVDRASWHAHGRLTSDEARDVERRGGREVILPCGEAVTLLVPDNAAAFDECRLGKAGEVLPDLFVESAGQSAPRA